MLVIQNQTQPKHTVNRLSKNEEEKMRGGERNE